MLTLAPLTAALLTATASAQTPIRCCTNPAVERAVEGVIAVAEAVANEPEDAADALSALRTTVKVDPSLPEADRAALAGIRRAAKAQGAKVDGAQLALGYLTRQAVFLALRHEGGDLVIAEGHCPERGGWLQSDLDALHRPWKGCGDWR